MRDRSLFLSILLAGQFLAALSAFSQDTTPPTNLSLTPAPGDTVVQLLQIDVVFSEEVQGIDAGDLLINGSPATTLLASIPGHYRFTFSQPPTGAVTVAWAPAHGITDL